MPRVATIEQQGAGAAGFHAFDQGGQVRKTTHLAIAFGCRLKVQVRQGIRTLRPQGHVGKLQQMLAHQVRQLTVHAANPEVDAGLTEINGQELCVAIGHVQERHLTEAGHVVQTFRGGGCISLQPRCQSHASHRAGTQDLKKFTFA